MKGKFLAIAIGTAVMTAGCQSLSKEEIGERIGAVTGAIVGKEVSGSDDELTGAVLGAAAGSIAGKMIGRHLDEQDQMELETRTQKALNREEPGTAEWESDRSSAKAEIRTGEVTYDEKRTEVKRISTVKAVPAITIENKRYRTTANLNVRTGPSTRYSVVTTLDEHEIVRSGGRTENGWLMLLKDGITVGYVHGGFVEGYQPQRVATRGSVNLDNVENPSSVTDGHADTGSAPEEASYKGIDLDAVNVESSQVQARTACRDVEIEVDTEKGRETKRDRACRNPDGAWELG